MSQKTFPFEKAYRTLLAIIVFLIPSNLFFKFFVDSAYVHGLLIDYLLPKIYLSDIFLFALFVVWFYEIWRKKLRIQLPIFLSALILIFFARQFFTDKPLASLWFFCKLLEFGAFGIFLASHRELLKSKIILTAWGVMIGFQSFVGLFQFFFQRSVFPSYYFLGEPSFLHRIILAKGVFHGVIFVLPYGTTAHPNILAGTLVIATLILTKAYFQKNANFIGAALFAIIPIVVLYLTQCASAALALIIGMFLLFFGQKILLRLSFHIFFPLYLAAFLAVPILIHVLVGYFPQNISIVRRDQLNQAAVQMILHQPLLGVGLNNFTAEVEKYNRSDEVVRFVQPAHHVGVLWFADTGILGLCIVAFLALKKIQLRKYVTPLCILFPILTLDHYLLTQQTGLLLTLFSLFFLGS